MKPKIIVDENIPFIQGRLEPHFDVTYVDQFGFTPELVKDADALVIRTRTLCNEQLLAGSEVRLIATATIGTDQIDIPWCEAHGITVRNAPGCNAPGVAQYVWSSLLRNRFDPASMTLGIVGCGNVGSIVAEWGRNLGARILVYDPPKRERGEDRNDPYEYFDNLEDMLAVSDAVTLHTPLTKKGKYPTHHLFGAKEISAMKRGATLINAARGAVLHTQEAVAALRGRNITTIIDTWEGEPSINVRLFDIAEIATFHIAGYSRQGKQRATRMAIEALEEHFGVNIDKTGLEGPYIHGAEIDSKTIVESYDPYTDTAMLHLNPYNFDILRANYDYRDEPKFSYPSKPLNP